MDDSPNQHQVPSGSGQLSPEPAEEKAGDDRSFALAGLFDDVDEGEDDASTRERIPREEAEHTVAQYKSMKVRPNIHDEVAFACRETAVLTHICHRKTHEKPCVVGYSSLMSHRFTRDPLGLYYA